MSRRARSAARQVGKTIRALEHTLSRSPEDHEIAAALGVSLEEYRSDLEMLTHVTVVDIEPHTATLGGRDSDSPAGIAEHRQLTERLMEGLGKIPERDAQILQLYYIEDLSYAEIGEVLNVSESRVCQLHARAIVRLRAELGTGMDDEEGDE
jgi:RNA polymerase sigma factor for flagellar operon FliA